MPGRVKCLPNCDCEKHHRPRMPPEVERARKGDISRAFYVANRDALLERARERRRDPVAGEELRRLEQGRRDSWSDEEREQRNADHRERNRRNPRSPEENARAHLYARYRMTPQDRQQMLDEQNGRCYLCGEALELNQPRKVHIDHDHECCPGGTTCGQCVRGIACDPCNRGVGHFQDDPARLRRVADALEAASSRVRARLKAA